ncbi:MAG: methyltransferase domain-containing protein [Methylacidiphilaceae bacterium]|nr:methyltransferase domain-containing protein [Candidatus Methylacidiphilaceae bacterium]
MSRREELTKHIRPEPREAFGIEVGPWFNPIFPKKEGYRCLVLDVYDRSTLESRALHDCNVPKEAIPNIEEVDLLGAATEIQELAEGAGYSPQIFDYVVSSHNFEHLPNPIRFLQGCAKVLKPGGILAMAIPDLRACFDYFRPPTLLAEWLEAYVANRHRPTISQWFAQHSLQALFERDGRQELTSSLREDPTKFIPLRTLAEAWNQWNAWNGEENQTYHDAHCSTFTPASFSLLIEDLRFLDLIDFSIVEVVKPGGFEFFVHLKRGKTFGQGDESSDAFYEKRRTLLFQIKDELAENSPIYQNALEALEKKRLGIRLRLRRWEQKLRKVRKAVFTR